MDDATIFENITRSVLDGDAEASRRLAGEALAAGIPAMKCMQICIEAIREVGRLWEAGEYFLPELVSGAESVVAALEILRPALAGEGNPATGPVAVLGTVEGDIHDIGKSLVGTMLTARGFEVVDLGSDVPLDRFVSAVRDHRASLLGLSALVTTTMVNQGAVVAALEREGLRSGLKVIVGGAPVSKSWADEIGADGTAPDAASAADLACRLLDTGA